MIITYEDLDSLFKCNDVGGYNDYLRNYFQKDVGTQKYPEKIPLTFREMFDYDYIVHENGKLEFID